MRSIDRIDLRESEADVEAREQESQPSEKKSWAWRPILSRVVLPLLVIRALLELVGLVTYYYIFPLLDRKLLVGADLRAVRGADILLLMWKHYDSGYYLWIARDGYTGADTLHSATNWAFFPLYPLLIHLTAAPIKSDGTLYYVMGCLVSLLAAIVAAVYLYKLTERELGERVASRAVLYLLVFPMSFYLFAIYPESLFLALTIGSIYYARERCWALAGLLGGLASLCRPTGVVLLAPLAWEYWQWRAEQFVPLQSREGVVASAREWLRARTLGLWRSLASWRTWLGFAYLALVPLGLFLFFLYAKLRTGTFRAYFLTEKYGWNRSLGNPLTLLLSSLRHPLPPSPYDWNFYALNMLSILIFVLLLIPVFRRLPSIYGIVALVLVVMPLTSGKLDSVARYYLTVFPVYMFLAWWSGRGSEEQQMMRHQLILIPCVLLLSLGMVLFTLGVYSMA